MKKLFEIIAEQQKGHENEPLFMVGEQLKEIASREPASAELLKKDLATEGMGLYAAAAALKQYADKNRGKARCFCISPHIAEKILREFYGLPSAEPASNVSNESPKEDSETAYIDLSSFL